MNMKSIKKIIEEQNEMLLKTQTCKQEYASGGKVFLNEQQSGWGDTICLFNVVHLNDLYQG